MRALAAVSLTVIGLVLVLSYRSPPVARTAPVAATSAPATPAPTTSGRARAAGPPSPTGSRTIDGPVVPTRFGDIQVAVTLNGRTIADVRALELPYDHPRSAYISDAVAPLLREEVMQAQSARIDTISGATYTSEAYAESLQAALDNARA